MHFMVRQTSPWEHCPAMARERQTSCQLKWRDTRITLVSWHTRYIWQRWLLFRGLRFNLQGLASPSRPTSKRWGHSNAVPLTMPTATSFPWNWQYQEVTAARWHLKLQKQIRKEKKRQWRLERFTCAAASTLLSQSDGIFTFTDGQRRALRVFLCGEHKFLLHFWLWQEWC